MSHVTRFYVTDTNNFGNKYSVAVAAEVVFSFFGVLDKLLAIQVVHEILYLDQASGYHTCSSFSSKAVLGVFMFISSCKSPSRKPLYFS